MLLWVLNELMYKRVCYKLWGTMLVTINNPINFCAIIWL